MNILSTARKTISLFLVFILTEGTTTAFFPSSSSFITEVRALSDYEMMMGESKSQYLPYKKDDIKCNNFNLNANGLNVNAIPKPLSALRPAQAQAEDGNIGTSTFGNDEKRFGSDNKDFAFKCVNNKDNELIRSPTTPTLPPPCEVTVDTITTGIGDVPIGIAYDSENERMYVNNFDDGYSLCHKSMSSC